MKKICFAENLKSLRTGAGLTQKQFAEICEVNQRTVSAWEKGICEPSYTMLAKICDFFNETFDNILT